MLAVTCICLWLALAGQTDNSAPHDPLHVAELDLGRAESSFESAHDAYLSNQIDAGDKALDEMNQQLTASLDSLVQAHKSRYYKKAELRVANLQRRLATLLEDIPLPQRGWAEQMSRRLDEIHDKLLEGVMRK